METHYNKGKRDAQIQNLIVEKSPLNWVSTSLKYNLNKGDLRHKLLPSSNAKQGNWKY
jgi:hypothetical protein